MGLLQPIFTILILAVVLLVRSLKATHVPRFYFPTSPLLLQVKRKNHLENGHSSNGDARQINGNGDAHGNKYDLMGINAFLRSRVPSLFEGYRPTWWLALGHLQTIFVVVGDFSKVDKVTYERTLIRTPDGGTLGLDLCPPPAQAPELPEDTPIIVVQTGLTGGSFEAYLRTILARACASKADGGLGFRGIVVNFRGCAGVPLTSPQLYSAGHTEDLRSAVLYIADKYPKAPLHGLGFSIGANILTRYLGEEGEGSRLSSGVTLACAWDTAKNSWRLENEFIPKTFYAKALGGNFLSVFTRHLDRILQFPPDERLTPHIPDILKLKNPTLLDVDHVLTKYIGGSSPPFPFETPEKYCKYLGSEPPLDHRRFAFPYLAINAADDPIVGFVPTVETQKSSTCALAVTPSGGHLGWFHGGDWFGRPDRWIRQPVLEWLAAVGEDYVPGSELKREARM
ncbi:hypothetical protein BS47DRAFT_1316969 [Hydnum rufescens UP504]|uniref:AB hydrolase-1 domain-containing protein n=1 Tax=Hydnum rufescens UP504 TaxID=1448309 RepID=A0A9P6DWZ6_9AGAM|nr:hypothetical protein BS47DRAFT_1316969 [Hydnum rufescens UP504]